MLSAIDALAVYDKLYKRQANMSTVPAKQSTASPSGKSKSSGKGRPKSPAKPVDHTPEFVKQRRAAEGDEGRGEEGNVGDDQEDGQDVDNGGENAGGNDRNHGENSGEKGGENGGENGGGDEPNGGENVGENGGGDGQAKSKSRKRKGATGDERGDLDAPPPAKRQRKGKATTKKAPTITKVGAAEAQATTKKTGKVVRPPRSPSRR